MWSVLHVTFHVDDINILAVEYFQNFQQIGELTANNVFCYNWQVNNDKKSCFEFFTLIEYKFTQNVKTGKDTLKS